MKINIKTNIVKTLTKLDETLNKYIDELYKFYNTEADEEND